jgi:hypothetical protein
VINTGAPKVVPMLMDKAKEQMLKLIDTNVERLNIDRIRTKLKVPTPLNIKMEVINYFKNHFAQAYPQTVRETVAPAIRSKLIELVQESRVGGVIEHIAKELVADFDRRFDMVLDRFNTGVDRFTEMRAREETWELLDTEMKPTSFEIEWNEKIDREFRDDLKSTFTERFVEYCGKLNVTLARHYQALISDLLTDFERLIDDVSGAVKKDPDRLTLPVKLLTGSTEETEEEKKQRCLLNYFRGFDTAKKQREEVSPYFVKR